MRARRSYLVGLVVLGLVVLTAGVFLALLRNGEAVQAEREAVDIAAPSIVSEA